MFNHRWIETVLRVGTAVTVAGIVTVAAVAIQSGQQIPKGWFLLGSMGVAISAFAMPWLLRKRMAWVAVIASVVLQLDVGRVSGVNCHSRGWFTAEAVNARQSCSFPKMNEGQLQSLLADSGVHPSLVPSINVQRFAEVEYKTAVDEIKSRVAQEQTLFLVKLAIAVVALGALFAVLWANREDKETQSPEKEHQALPGEASESGDGESPNQQESDKVNAAREFGNWVFANAFFWATVLVSAIIDNRIRFNSKMMETIGCWLHLLELKSNTLLWETYVRGTGVFFQPPMYELLRSFPTLLTILLFTGIVYFTLILDDEPRGMSRWCAFASLILFAFTGASYHSESKVWLAHCFVWAVAGSLALLRGSRTLKAIKKAGTLR